MKAPRKRFIGCLLVLVAFLVVGTLIDAFFAEDEPTPQGKRPAGNDSELPVIGWTAHDFTITEDNDTSFGGRSRRRVYIVAPAAVTREDRIATLMVAVKQVWGKHHSQFIGAFLLPYASADGPVATIGYAPDKCGVTGKDCTGQVWTNVTASNVTLTEEKGKHFDGWMEHEENSMSVTIPAQLRRDMGD